MQKFPIWLILGPYSFVTDTFRDFVVVSPNMYVSNFNFGIVIFPNNTDTLFVLLAWSDILLLYLAKMKAA